MLFPDMTRPQHEAQEFCFASPCTPTEFAKLRSRASKYKGYLPYTIVMEDDEKIAIILLGFTDAKVEFAGEKWDERAKTTAAYLRLVKEFNGMIYCMTHARKEHSNSIASIIVRTAGVPPHQVRHVEL